MPAGEVPAGIPQAAGATSPCDLSALTVSTECSFDAFLAGEPWGRLVVKTVVTGGAETRTFGPEPVKILDFRARPKLEPRVRLGWLLEGRVALVGPDPGLRLGTTWYRTGRRIGFVLDAEYVKRDSAVVPANPYLETSPYAYLASRGHVQVGVGAAVRFP